MRPLRPFNRQIVLQRDGPDLAPEIADDLTDFLTGGVVAIVHTWIVDGPAPPWPAWWLLHDALSGEDAQASFVSYPHATHGTWRPMLEDATIGQDASITSTHDGQPRPCRPSWDTIIAFLNEHLRAPFGG